MTKDDAMYRNSSPTFEDADLATSETEQPLFGVILCCTSIASEQRDGITKISNEMGAVSKLDLTSDVTHLLVGEVDTPKYKYVAKERPDIKVLDISWLHAVHKSWKDGEVVDLRHLNSEHRLPTLFNLRICVTGFENLTKRSELSQAITSNGAQYHGDLTKSVTHLIAATAKGKKYEFAGVWGIKIVTVEWLHQSLIRGMVLDEQLFHPLTPISQRGIGAFRQQSPPADKRKRESDNTNKDTYRRKLRRTASTRLESQNGELWADIGSEEFGPGPAAEKELRDGATIAWLDTAKDLGPLPPAQASVRRQQTLPSPATEISPSMHRGIFEQQRFCIRGFVQDHCDKLKDHLEANGATVISWEDLQALKKRDLDVIPTTVLLPHDADSSMSDDTTAVIPEHCALTSEWWVEKCLFSKTNIAKDHILYQPLGSCHLKAMETIVICPTSFVGIDLMHFSKAVKLLGARYDETLTLKTSILVCGTGPRREEKLRYALQHSIPIVKEEWLLTCIQNKRVESIKGYLLPGQSKCEPLRDAELRRVSPQAQVKPDIELRRLAKQPSQTWLRCDGGGPEAFRSASDDRPLREITPHANSQTRSQQESEVDEALDVALRRSKNRRDDMPTGVVKQHDRGIAPQTDRFKEAMEQLQRTWREDTGVLEVPATRKSRQLGRAQSNSSSFNAKSTADNRQQTIVAAQQGDAEEDEDTQQPTTDMGAGMFRPSQKLSYENDGSVAAREQLLQRLGVADQVMGCNESPEDRCGDIGGDGLEDGAVNKMRRVESVGIAKDMQQNMGGVARKVTRRRP